MISQSNQIFLVTFLILSIFQVAALESAISDKKQQVEQLVTEMKEANLQSLAIAPAEELKHLLEG